MYEFEFVVSLRFISEVEDPCEISKQLGLKPKWQHKIGEPRTTPQGIPLSGVYDESYCSFSLNRKDNEDLHEMLDRIVSDLLPHKDLFRRIEKNGGRAEFFIGWFSNGNTGDTFHNSLLRKLGELKIDLAFDVYGENKGTDLSS